MNMARYWHEGWLPLLVAQFNFCSSYYRPMGGLYYMPLMYWFGIDPLPYRIVILIALAANALLAYFLGRLLSRSVMIGAIAAALTAYHGSLFALYYNTSQVYDVLCFLFWMAGFLVYARVRVRGHFLSPKQLAAVLALYICALNSKEMAVTFPVLLLTFELSYFGWRQWRRVALAIILTSLVTLAFVIGKTTGPDAISGWETYKPIYSLRTFLRSN